MMLRSVKELRKYRIHAIDGYIGKAYGFYFDDNSWLIRYLVVDIGNWFSDRQIIIIPAVLSQPDRAKQEFPVFLRRDEVANSPDADSDKPVSRQRADELSKDIDMPIYGLYGEYGAGAVIIAERQAEKESDKGGSNKENIADSHLRSTREIIGYGIKAIDGSIGHIDDLIIDDESWAIKYAVVDTRKWLSGRKALIPINSIEKIKWSESRVYVSLSQESIKKSPKFNPSMPVNQTYEGTLYDYYGRPKHLT